MLQELLKIYAKSRVNQGKPECLFAETLIFNEGWLLRATLKEWQSRPQQFMFDFVPFPRGVKVYSEAQMYTPFKARTRGDKQAESHTRVDGIVGNFEIAGTKTGVVLKPDCRYLTVFEAKMYSPLSEGTTNAPHFGQLSRTAACMINAMLQTERKDSITAHLVVLYAQDNRRISPDQYTMAHVEAQISERIRAYSGSSGQGEVSSGFFREWKRVLNCILIRFLTWEDVLAEIGSDDLNRFYDLCKRFN